MSHDVNQSKPMPPRGDNSTVIDFDALGDIEEFVRPEDLVGDDLAAQLQSILDESKAQPASSITITAKEATVSPAPAPSSLDEVSADPSEDAHTFETPADVIDQPVTPMPPEDPEGFNEQLRELLSLAAPNTTDKSSPEDTGTVEETTGQAETMTEEIERMTAMIHRAVTPVPPPTDAGNDADETFAPSPIDQLMGEPDAHESKPAVPAASVAPSVAASESKRADDVAMPAESMQQLDEFLAGHADHAVSDEFDTVDDVTEMKQPAPIVPTTAPIANGAAEAAVEEDEFSSPDQLLAGPGEAAADRLATAVAPAPIATNTVAQRRTEQDETSAPAPRIGRVNRIRVALARAISAGKPLAFRVCCTISRPLLHRSQSTRNLIGYVGLITLANATLLVLGKLLNLI